MAQTDDFALRIRPISPAGSGPLYQQIVAGFKREIGDNCLPEGAPLPSFRLMAKQLLVSVITVKRAYEELEREGIVYRCQGLGTFVAADGRNRSRASKQKRAKALIQSAIKEADESRLTPEETKKWIDQTVIETLRRNPQS